MSSALGAPGSTREPEAEAMHAPATGARRKRHPLAKIKGGWTAEEDSELIRLVLELGEGNWSPIARALNTAVGKDESNGRIGKQCRERWNHHLRPDIKKDAWNREEEDLLVKSHQEMGNRWSDIAKTIPGRSENAVKNHWNATLRRRDLPDPDPGPLKLYMQGLNLIRPQARTRRPVAAQQRGRSKPGGGRTKRRAGRRGAGSSSDYSSDEGDSSGSSQGSDAQVERAERSGPDVFGFGLAAAVGRTLRSGPTLSHPPLPPHMEIPHVATTRGRGAPDSAGTTPHGQDAGAETGTPHKRRRSGGAGAKDECGRRAGSLSTSAASTAGQEAESHERGHSGMSSFGTHTSASGRLLADSRPTHPYTAPGPNNPGSWLHGAAASAPGRGDASQHVYNNSNGPSSWPGYISPVAAAAWHGQQNMGVNGVVGRGGQPTSAAGGLEPRMSSAGDKARVSGAPPATGPASAYPDYSHNPPYNAALPPAPTNGTSDARLREQRPPPSSHFPATATLDAVRDYPPTLDAHTAAALRDLAMSPTALALEAALALTGTGSGAGGCGGGGTVGNFLLDSDDVELMELLGQGAAGTTHGAAADAAGRGGSGQGQLVLPAAADLPGAGGLQASGGGGTVAAAAPATWEPACVGVAGTGAGGGSWCNGQTTVKDEQGRVVTRSGSNSSLHSSYSVGPTSPACSLGPSAHNPLANGLMASPGKQAQYHAGSLGLTGPTAGPAAPQPRWAAQQQQQQYMIRAFKDGPNNTLLITTAPLPGMDFLLQRHMPAPGPADPYSHTASALVTLKMGSKGPIRVCLPELSAQLAAAGLPSSLPHSGGADTATDCMVADLARMLQHVCGRVVRHGGLDAYLVAIKLGCDTPVHEYSVLLAVRGRAGAEVVGRAVDAISKGLAPLLC